MLECSCAGSPGKVVSSIPHHRPSRLTLDQNVMHKFVILLEKFLTFVVCVVVVVWVNLPAHGGVRFGRPFFWDSHHLFQKELGHRYSWFVTRFYDSALAKWMWSRHYKVNLNG
ncbi:hypothetical protein EJ08DRAFT_186801 [Tothia fuscella]|uniref:Uncharacterized protein n=1 Tax=Tothia fuscella TaxID=1048955 RepID=A0A9P4NTI3_9PEZI|nr:hypothetical protein EJ08DRAFT_186801 [Tothia fuscella]